MGSSLLSLRPERLLLWVRLLAPVVWLSLGAAAQSNQSMPSAGRIYQGVVPGRSNDPPAWARRPQTRASSKPMITWLGFQPLAEKNFRFFVQSTQPLTPSLKIVGKRVEIFFSGATVYLRNNTRPLDTRFFEVPVDQARLEQRPGGVTLVFEMRADASPVVSAQTDGEWYFIFVDFLRSEVGGDSANQ